LLRLPRAGDRPAKAEYDHGTLAERQQISEPRIAGSRQLETKSIEHPQASGSRSALQEAAILERESRIFIRYLTGQGPRVYSVEKYQDFHQKIGVGDASRRRYMQTQKVGIWEWLATFLEDPGLWPLLPVPTRMPLTWRLYAKPQHSSMHFSPRTVSRKSDW
jgi:hypothetical protein